MVAEIEEIGIEEVTGEMIKTGTFIVFVHYRYSELILIMHQNLLLTSFLSKFVLSIYLFIYPYIF